jgi:hypothetical protein
MQPLLDICVGQKLSKGGRHGGGVGEKGWGDF